jgi:hypothetical protein
MLESVYLQVVEAGFYPSLEAHIFKQARRPLQIYILNKLSARIPLNRISYRLSCATTVPAGIHTSPYAIRACKLFQETCGSFHAEGC